MPRPKFYQMAILFCAKNTPRRPLFRHLVTLSFNILHRVESTERQTWNGCIWPRDAVGGRLFSASGLAHFCCVKSAMLTQNRQ